MKSSYHSHTMANREQFEAPCLKLSDSAIRVLEARYLLKDEDGRLIESPQEMFRRVASAIARVEAKWWRADKKNGFRSRREIVHHFEQEYFALLSELRFLPNSPTLMNAGRKGGQLSACFVLPIEDSLESVFETLKNSALVHKSGGGTGFNFGRMRPKGDLVKSSGGQASGPLGALKIFDAATNMVKQGGTRRGANMAILPINHPDILNFINSKRDGGIENFNISVGVTNTFMKAVKKNLNWPLVNPRNNRVVKKIAARELWNSIAEAAWATGDPGVVFIDRINVVNPTPKIGRMESTNPCGEQPLLPYESCNLGSMNLTKYLTKNSLDWASLEKDIKLSIRFLDNVIEANSYPLEEIKDITYKNRKIGLGIMGWADALIHWGIPYDCEQALKVADRLGRKLLEFSRAASEDLAKQRGRCRSFENSLWAKKNHPPRRNITVTTIAPTGTISIIAGVSSGIEPVFALAYNRTALDGKQLKFIHPFLARLLEGVGKLSKKDIAKILNSGSVQDISRIPKDLKNVLKTSHEIEPIWHVRMQAAFQKHVENGVSKTINLANSATPKQVQRIYEKAYEFGCKGITVFRDRSKNLQVIRKGLWSG